MQILLRLLTIITFIFFTDFLLYKVSVKIFVNILLRKTVKRVHLGIIGLFIVFSIVLVAITGDPGENYKLYRNYFLWMDVFFVLYIPKIFLLLTLSPLLLFGFGRRPGRMTRSSILVYLRYKYLWITVSFFITLLVLFVTLDGITRQTARFVTKKVDLYFTNLPKGFEGFTIAQFSDLHLGSWRHKKNVLDGLNKLQSLNANIIVFTGDLINVNAEETTDYKEAFRNLSAIGGKFAILGNHDMGDFAKIDRDRNLGTQLPALVKFYEEQDFHLLRNSHLVIHKNNDSIIIAGVDNWSDSHFTKFGDLDKAMKGAGNTFTVLLSHDPTHWNAEILPKTKVELTLSGHTHGGQLGINLFGYSFSPIQFRYPQWNGLYEMGSRFLYVNKGMGFVGYSGRIGMLPEITLFQLHTK